MKNQASEQTRARRYLAVILAVVIGTTVSIAITTAIARWHSQLAEREFVDQARDHAQALDAGIQNVTDVLYTLRDFVETADHMIGREEYQAYARRLRERNPGLRDSGFIAYVPDSERAAFEQSVRTEGFPDFQIKQRNPDGSNAPASRRAQYYPIFYPEPIERTPQVLGLDLGADPLRLAAIERSIATGQAAGTDPLTLLTSEQKLTGFQSFVPIHRSNPADHESAPQLKGFIIGVFEIGPMIEAILDVSTRPIGMDIYFYNAGGTLDQRLIYWHSARTRSIRAPVPTESELQDRMHWTTTFTIADRKWGAIFVTAKPREFISFGWQAIAALMCGLTITATTAAYFLTSIRRTLHLESVTDNLNRISAELRTESHKATDAEKQIRAVTDNLPMLIAYVDSERRIQFINKTGENWYAQPSQDILGKTVAEVIGYPSDTSTPDILEKLVRGSVHRERTGLYPDGKTRTVEVLNIPDFDHNGKVRGYYAILTDITERKANEEKFQQIQKLESIGKLTGGVAHDVNNMLAVISGNLELACEDIEQGIDVRKKLHTALRATERGSTLTQSLLSFARQQPLAPQSLDLNTIAADVVDFSRRTLTKNIDVKLVCADDLWRCNADPGQMQNALLNLIINARDAMPDGGELTVETGNIHFDPIDTALAEIEPGDYVILTVSDTGTGMSPEILARVFEPFFTTKNASEGTGLGLSMVYGFVKQSGGHAKIYSEVGHGTSVRIYLPRNAESLKNMTSQPRADHVRGHGETILVVEDNPDVRTLVCSLLHSLNYKVLDAGSTDEGLDCVRGHNDIEMLLSDVMLPGALNGPRLAEEARRIRPNLKVLFMSGYTENALIHNGRLADDVQLLQKPFSKDDLARKVRGILGMKEFNE